jgi:HK97 family phage major capsid protein
MTLKELRAKHEAKKAELKNVMDQSITEKRSMSKTEIKQFDDIDAELQTLEREIRAKEITPSKNIHIAPKVNDDEVKEFRHFLRTAERRAGATGQSNNTPADGKYTNPNAFSNELFKEITSDNGVLSLVRSMSVTSDQLDFPTVDDTGTGKGVDLKQAKELDVIKARKLAIANVNIKLNTYAVETVISNQLRDDNAVNLESVVAELGSAGIARNASKDLFAVIDAGITISDSVASGIIDYTDLVTLLGSVNGKYYAKGQFLMSQAKFISILGLLDSNKAPIVRMPVENGMKPSLFGKPITIDDNAGDNIYFGDFTTVILAQNTNTNTLVDIYSLSSDLATKYVTSARMGGGVLSAKAVHGLKAKV